MSAFDIELSEEQRLIRDAARDFAHGAVAPLAKKIDADHYFPAELVPQLGQLGFWGICVPEEYGGAGLDAVSYGIIVEELAYACASTSVVISAHNSLCLMPIVYFGTEEQKKKYLPKLSSGEHIGCFALSEPNTGSDASALLCSCKNQGTSWVINGVKNWITNGPVANICLLLAMEDPSKGHKGVSAFIVDLKTPGITIGKKEDKLGICGSPTSSITFENVVLPKEALLGQVGEGFKIAMKCLDGGRIGIASQAVGIARAAMDAALAYSQQRKTFGKFICEHQTIKNYLADMSCRIDAAKLMILHAAKRKDSHLPFSRQAAQAKLLASETAMAVTVKAVQIHGGYGYVKDFPVERHMRDAKITEIYEGTSEVQRIVIANELLKA